MALINCKECNKEVSDQALTCPHCGITAPGIGDEEVAIELKRNQFLANRWVGGLPFWIGVLMVVYPVFTGQDKQVVVEAWGFSKFLILFGVIF